MNGKCNVVGCYLSAYTDDKTRFLGPFASFSFMNKAFWVYKDPLMLGNAHPPQPLVPKSYAKQPENVC